jgi:hypothetical protein
VLEPGKEQGAGQVIERADPPSDLARQGVLSAWNQDALAPAAEWRRRPAPGNEAIWGMQLRRRAPESSGAAGVRFKASAWPEDPAEEPWELPLPLSMSDRARELIDETRHRP